MSTTLDAIIGGALGGYLARDKNRVTKADLTDVVIHQFADNYVPVLLRKRVLEGKAFTAGKRFESVADGDTVYIYLGNPSGSGKTINIVTIIVGATAKVYVDVYVANSISSAGTTITPMNLNLGSSNTSIAHVEYGGTYTLGNKMIEDVIPGGKRGRAIGTVVEIGETTLLPQGTNIVIAVTNKGGTAQDISIRPVWWEE